LQRRYRSIKTYRGQGVDDPSATVRLDVTPQGFHAQVISPAGTVLVDPAGGAYRSASTGGFAPSQFACSAEERGAAPMLAAAAPVNPSGDSVRTYRLAVAATGEFSVASLGPAAAAARIATLVNRVVGIYEKEVAVSFTLVMPPVVFPDPLNDPFLTGGVVDSALLAQNQAVLDTTVGSGTYDIGHVLTVAAAPAGGAQIGGTCNPALKGQGATAVVAGGDPLAVEGFAHVIGHQLGAHHTFNGTADACGGLDVFGVAQRHALTAYEPGSGSTLMSFAGLCGAENVQALPDTYFHTASFDEITAFRDDPLAGAACGTAAVFGNSAPVVDAGPDATIPRGTPVTLTASATDPDAVDAGQLTYCWEQFDLGVVPPDETYDPLFRSLPPTVSPARTFPALADLLSGTTSAWERLPMVDRTLTFRATARDNRAGGGGVDYDELALTVAGDPFLITAPAAGGSLECGDLAPLTWQVGGGSVATDVRALVSTDGGASFGEAAMDSTLNDGAASLTVPKTPAPAARVKLEAVGNVFFALSGALTIDDTLMPVVTAPPDLPAVECTSSAGASPLLGDAVAADLCDDAPVLVNDAPPVFPLTLPPTTVTVTWTATDASGNSGTDAQLVTVVDTTPPSIVAPADVTAECTSPLGTPVDLGAPVVSDVCDDSVAVSNDAPPLFPLGMTTVLWTAADDHGNSASAGQAVTVVDTTPPVLTLSLSPTALWPPNHKLHTVRAAITVVDICDAAPTVRLVSVTSDEPDNGKGDGNTAGDIVGATTGEDDREFQLRAERSGGGDGRVYTVTYEARDASGNTTTGAATVTVPHDQGK
jgi:hypothetical protein